MITARPVARPNHFSPLHCRLPYMPIHISPALRTKTAICQFLYREALLLQTLSCWRAAGQTEGSSSALLHLVRGEQTQCYSIGCVPWEL